MKRLIQNMPVPADDEIELHEGFVRETVTKAASKNKLANTSALFGILFRKLTWLR